MQCDHVICVRVFAVKVCYNRQPSNIIGYNHVGENRRYDQHDLLGVSLQLVIDLSPGALGDSFDARLISNRESAH